MSEKVTFYSGVGADEEIDKLLKLVGEITSRWAEVEDQLFTVFVFAVSGQWLNNDIRPYRAVFFAFGSFEAKMTMTNKAFLARYDENEDLLSKWGELRKALNGFSSVRNKVAHLVPMAKSFKDPTTPANVRLVPPFWKGIAEKDDFDSVGFSRVELLKEVAPYWGYDPRLTLYQNNDSEAYQLAYRPQKFAIEIQSFCDSDS